MAPSEGRPASEPRPHADECGTPWSRRSGIVRTRRRTGKADRRNYFGKHRDLGLHFLALTDERGRLVWISAARPGRTHEVTAARHDHIVAHLRAAGLGALADHGFRGLNNDVLDPVIVTGFHAGRTHKLTPGQKTANSPRTQTGRARLRPPQVLASPRRTPHRSRPRPPPAEGAARADEARSYPLTGDLRRRPPLATSGNMPTASHIEPWNCYFKLARAHSSPTEGDGPETRRQLRSRRGPALQLVVPAAVVVQPSTRGFLLRLDLTKVEARIPTLAQE
ncbi:transposase family protein [Streptomyces sp. NPDC059446]|uniref:transposase family protein n=1 Tax=Streptomyces sp. NPDC059446 TaxID=3346833 RepID=UPI0036B99DB1